MNDILINIQDTVTKYAEVLSKVLKVDIEIVDSKLVRIAGTGMYGSKINENMGEEGYVYKKVIDSGKRHLIYEPGQEEICKNCYKYKNCEETFEVSMPIKIDKEVIGVIGLVCFTNEQRDHILSNLDTFTDFLEQIADLIALKVQEELKLNRVMNISTTLRNILNRVDQGVLIMDKENKIEDINTKGMQILDLKLEPQRVTRITETGNKILDYNEYELLLDDNKYLVLAEEFKLYDDPINYKKLLVFTDYEWLKEISSSISTTKEFIDIDYIKGNSSKVIELKQRIKSLQKSSSTVMITGESGTGKELFSRAVHIESNRKEKPFVALNCAAIPDTLLESELFGYTKGAFTGADPKGKIGKIEFAEGGTLFLDEIGDMPIYLQSKLLRVLEEREIVRIGSNKSIPVDIRVIAATNKNLEELIEENKFREDLYYRLNVIPIHIPPLRERKDDIPILTNFFIKKYSKLFEKNNIIFSSEVMKYLMDYEYPGNVRELENIVEYIMNMVKTNEVARKKHIPKNIIEKDIVHNDEFCLKTMEKQYIKKALDNYGYDVEGKKVAASQLGIGIATLYRKMNEYNLSK